MWTQEDIKALIEALNNPEKISEAQDKLIKIGSLGVPLLINALGDSDVSLAASDVLREIGAIAVEPLVAALGDENKSISAYTALVLEDIGQTAVEPLIKALSGKGLRTRILIVRVLGQIGDDRAVASLTQVFKEAELSFYQSALLDETLEALRKLGKIVEKSKETALIRGKTGQRTEKSQKLLSAFIEGLKNKGFEMSPRSNRLFYHPSTPGKRFAIDQRVIRFERKGRNRRWQLVKSYSIVHETHLALVDIDLILR